MEGRQWTVEIYSYIVRLEAEAACMRLSFFENRNMLYSFHLSFSYSCKTLKDQMDTYFTSFVFLLLLTDSQFYE